MSDTILDQRHYSNDSYNKDTVTLILVSCIILNNNYILLYIMLCTAEWNYAISLSINGHNAMILTDLMFFLQKKYIIVKKYCNDETIISTVEHLFIYFIGITHNGIVIIHWEKIQ